MALSNSDLKAIRQITKEEIDDKFKNFTMPKKFWGDFDEHLDTVLNQKFDEKIEEKGLVTKSDISHLPTKDEFYKSQDKLMKELKAIREESAVTLRQYKRTNKRVDLIDKHLGIITSDIA